MKVFKKTIGEMFDETVEKYPDREALRFQGRGESYSELQQKVNKFARGLIRLGIQQGDKVAIWMPNYPEWIYANLAIAKIGAVTVPINIRFKTTEVAYVVKNSNVTTLIMADKFFTNNFADMAYEICPEIRDATQGNIKSAALPALRKVISLKEMQGTLPFTYVTESLGDTGSHKELTQRQSNVKADDVVNVFYTSGTTGSPKGAMADHNILMNIANYIDWMQITNQDIIQAPSPLFYTTANYWCMHQ
jgi:fatty-acyl-CoA synthase